MAEAWRFETLDGTVPVVERVCDVVCGRGGERPLLLDLYRPADVAGTFPVVVLIHGGGWHGGDKADYADLARKLAGEGFACAAVNYRLLPDWRFPAMLEDCKCAVRWLRANAAEVGVDPGRFAVWGHSAGAHLAAMVALTPGLFEGTGGSEGASSAVQCALPFSGPLDLWALAEVLPSAAMLVGQPAPVDPAPFGPASPITYAAECTVPFLVVHGIEDDLVPVSQADSFVAALQAHGKMVEAVRLEGVGHDLGQASPEVFGRAVRFLREHL